MISFIVGAALGICIFFIRNRKGIQMNNDRLAAYVILGTLFVIGVASMVLP